MSRKHPIVAVTGSSGAGTSTVKNAFEHIFRREHINPVIIEGDSFHRYNRVEMKQAMKEAAAQGNNHFSHFGPEANLFDKLEEMFKTYGETGGGKKRYYIHNEEEADNHNGRLGTSLKAGEFTPWEDIPDGTDLMFYEGLHGLVTDGDVSAAQHVDLGIGVVPIVNLEWIQKIFRDNAERGYTAEAIVDTMLRRMPDYVHYITPQFSKTDINFQRVPMVDTSNPFIARDIPTPDESMVVIRFRDPKKFGVDFPYLLNMLHDSFMSRRNTIVVPGGKMGLAMEVILAPIIAGMLEKRR
ncbi:phosphoribulokinase [Ectothiorhodospira haloalkaliphila]|uniref:Phosphoribulokinase n=1 Tax=Ectothiorhodospira haloalkaliphila TaxID=421628 RepID=W8KTX2_9GAMM|nr:MULTISPECIES: phosphoribulokinase [Ectothiorhodospira]AHK80482.1 phosphoribulokinase [Ectothiorhodospira haloalkaliphila]MCG5494287.1 phosphoribulokinase [Ectothiorhodospira variabilis]MCG5496452.1 phosphoribulokinase [Ectothiorhodospira variabilis]MCG5504054.1 phosphoribulokinase [Ectothiorhodospira variabilis]MCG5507209.1 phosphoribulokinase [Ectothiorhodospira variabilis]